MKSNHFKYLSPKFSSSLLLSGLLWTVLTATSVVIVLILSKSEIDYTKEYAKEGVAQDLATALHTQISDISRGALALGAHLIAIPCPDIPKSFNIVSENILQWNDFTEQLSFDLAGRVNYSYPTNPDWSDGFLIFPEGFDIFMYNPELMEIVLQSKEFMLGPFPVGDGSSYGIIAAIPLWKKAESFNSSISCGIETSNCTATLCYNEADGTKFYGFSRAAVEATTIVSGNLPAIESVESAGYSLKITSIADKILPNDPSFQMLFGLLDCIYETSKAPIPDSVATDVRIHNLHWKIELAPRDGWVPIWRDPCLAACAAVSLSLAGMLYSLLRAKEKNRRLLASMLPPKAIAHYSKDKREIFSEKFDMVTIFFCDICDYTPMASQLEPIQIVELLNDLYSIYDQLAIKHGVYKVETIGDACVAGCPEVEHPSVAAAKIVNFAMDVIAEASRFHHRHLLSVGRSDGIRTRIGVHSGPCVAGIVGSAMPRYCLFGDVVNTASRMESTSKPMRIQISSDTATLLLPPKRDSDGDSIVSDYRSQTSISTVANPHDSCPPEIVETMYDNIRLCCRGEISVKGKGLMTTYWVEESVSDALILSDGSSRSIHPPSPASVIPLSVSPAALSILNSSGNDTPPPSQPLSPKRNSNKIHVWDSVIPEANSENV